MNRLLIFIALLGIIVLPTQAFAEEKQFTDKDVQYTVKTAEIQLFEASKENDQYGQYSNITTPTITIPVNEFTCEPTYHDGTYQTHKYRLANLNFVTTEDLTQAIKNVADPNKQYFVQVVVKYSLDKTADTVKKIYMYDTATIFTEMIQAALEGKEYIPPAISLVTSPLTAPVYMGYSNKGEVLLHNEAKDTNASEDPTNFNLQFTKFYEFSDTEEFDNEDLDDEYYQFGSFSNPDEMIKLLTTEKDETTDDKDDDNDTDDFFDDFFNDDPKFENPSYLDSEVEAPQEETPPENPETYSVTYLVAGFMVLIFLSTTLFVIYEKNKKQNI